jgi:hypothetical protein
LFAEAFEMTLSTAVQLAGSAGSASCGRRLATVDQSIVIRTIPAQASQVRERPIGSVADPGVVVEADEHARLRSGRRQLRELRPNRP